MQAEQKPNFLERVAVKGLLFLEDHLEKKPSPPVDWAERRQLLQEVGGSFLLVGTAAIAGTALRFIWEHYQNEQIARKRDAYLQALKEREDYYGISWQSSPDVQLAIKKANEDPNLKVLGLNKLGIRIYSQGNTFFYQSSNMAVLAVDKKALDSFLRENEKTKETLAFIISDQQTPAPNISGINNFRLELKIEKQPPTITLNTSPKQIVGINLSSNVAAIYESYQKDPYRTMQMLTRPITTSSEWQQFQDSITLYRNRFTEGKLEPFIKTVAINPIWLP
ncbi:MAG: hypothetical protein Q8P92_05240 [Candidatus Daviesbacteria bacterium]|nr:hypothetical protein [Candidatus Daviesbacteria bacterium]